MAKEDNFGFLDYNYPNIEDIYQLIEFGPVYASQQSTLEYLSDENGKYDVSKILITPGHIVNLANTVKIARQAHKNIKDEKLHEILRGGIEEIFEGVVRGVNNTIRPKYKKVLGLGKVSTRDVMIMSAIKDNQLFDIIRDFNNTDNSLN